MNINCTSLVLAMVAPLFTIGAAAAPPETARLTGPTIAPRFELKAKAAQNSLFAARKAHIDHANHVMYTKKGMAKAASLEPDFSLPASSDLDYLDGPDGRTWFYVSHFEYEKVEYEYFTENYMKSYKFDIYTPEMKYYGSIQDDVRLEGNETKVARLQLAPQLSKKFFNSRDDMEVMVSVMCNNPDYSITSRTLAYTIGGEKDENGNDKVICTLPGLLVDILDASADEWSETFYMTFENDFFDDSDVDPNKPEFEQMIDAYYLGLTTYGKAGWGGEPSVVYERNIRNICLPGDQQSATPLITLFHNKTPYLVINEYENNLYNDQESPMDDLVQAEGNNLVVTVYELSKSGVKEVQRTKIPVEIEADQNTFFSYYSIGNLTYRGDVSFGGYGVEPDKAAFIVTKWNYLLNTDDYDYSYYVYDNLGARKITLAERTESFVPMNDVRGFDPQYLFITNDEGIYSFNFTNIISGEIETYFSNNIMYKNEILPVTANIDRYPVGNSYQYVSEIRTPGLDAEGNDIMRIAWINTDGKIENIDELNMGTDIRIAQSYIDQTTLSPYFFNTDAAREYMLLVKRGQPNSDAAIEELMVCQVKNREYPMGQTLLSITPDAEKGRLSSIYPIIESNNNRLLVAFYDGEKIHQDFYNLPLTKFAGGDGTADNPYLIASIGDLARINDNPSAHYALSADFDASGMEFSAICDSSAPFTGVLDGRGHKIYNLYLSSGYGSAIFNSIANAVVKNITFINPAVDPKGGHENAVISRNAANSQISGIHVVGLECHSSGRHEALFGGIVGMATNFTKITDCSVVNAEISIPGASFYSPVGGIVGATRTGTEIHRCSFIGSINGGSYIGGIVGSTNRDEKISNCHVDADIKAKNTVGGIIGYSNRAVVSNCYVEGFLEATEKIENGGYKAGGLIGQLENFRTNSVDMSSSGTSGDTEIPVIVSNNMVNMESITVPSDVELNYTEKSVHRIIGMSSDNNYELDWDKSTDNNPVYFDPTPEKGLENNHAVASMVVIDSAIEASHDNIEGASIEASEINNGFFTGLGFAFGTDSENPWKEMPEHDPSLYHEIGASFTLPVIEANEGEPFTMDLLIVSRTKLDEETVTGSFTCDSENEEIAACNGMMSLEGNMLTIGFDALKQGSTDIKASVLGNEASFKVNVYYVNAIDEIASDNAHDLKITYNGESLTANGTLEIFTLQGVKVAAGVNTVSVIDLPAGFYAAIARSVDGRSASLKFVVK